MRTHSNTSTTTSLMGKARKKKKGIMTFLPAEALAIICTYDMNMLRDRMAICADWHCKIREGFDRYFKEAENRFLMQNSKHLMFKESFLSSQPISFCGKSGLRVD